MDMRRILQAIDGTTTKPVEGVNSMAKFLRVVKEAELNQAPPSLTPEQLSRIAQYLKKDTDGSQYYELPPTDPKEIGAIRGTTITTPAALAQIKSPAGQQEIIQQLLAMTDPANAVTPVTATSTPMSDAEAAALMPASENINESANPHKVALPVQMAMRHYQNTVTETKPRTRLIDKYFVEAEQAIQKKADERRALINQYAESIAQRVLMKESVKEGSFDSKSKVDWNKRSKELFLKGLTEQQVRAQLIKEGCPPKQVDVYVQAGQLGEAGEAGWGRADMAGVGLQPIDEMPIDMTGDPNDPTVYGHEKANPMSLKGRIMSARAQLKELAQMAESNDLATWEQITKLHKGGMFMGLAQNLEQIRHGIEELASKRRKGGVASRGIDKHIGEVYDGEPDEYHVLRHQTKDDIDREITMPAAWTRVKEFDSYQAARRLYNELKEKNPGQKYTITTHSKSKRDAFRKEHGLGESLKDPKDNPCWKGYKPVGTKKKAGKTVPNCVPKK